MKNEIFSSVISMAVAFGAAQDQSERERNFNTVGKVEYSSPEIGTSQSTSAVIKTQREQERSFNTAGKAEFDSMGSSQGTPVPITTTLIGVVKDMAIESFSDDNAARIAVKIFDMQNECKKIRMRAVNSRSIRFLARLY